MLGAAKLGHWYWDTRHYGGDELCYDTEEVTPTLGIETAGGLMFKYTDRRSLTINKMYTFSTTEDNQDRVVIRVFEGVGKRTNQNLFLGAIELTGITPALKGVPQIRVRLSTYASGTYINLNVMDVASGRSNAAIFFASKEWNDYYGLNSECEFTESGAFELEPAGKLTLSHSHYIKITE